MDYNKLFAEEIVKNTDGALSLESIMGLVEKPKFDGQGDLAFPCFSLAKIHGKAPHLIAGELAGRIKHTVFENIVAVGPYVNCFLKKSVVSKDTLQTILEERAAYGVSDIGQGRNITIDFSSPNIAKPFSMGHLRSTVIGNSLAKIVEKVGYKAVGINHLGDWGTQFGKLIVAYKKWGDDAAVKENPIPELLALYIKFHEEAKDDPGLEDDARKWFWQLENGDLEAEELWTWFKDESLKEFSKIYELLEVDFDSYAGEAFYNDKMAATIELLKSKELLTESQGAEVVDLTEEGLPPFLIRKSDGATLYGTRDLTAALYRKENYHFAKSLYVVGQEQTLHFRQLKLVLKKMGYDWSDNMEHIPFGFILKDGKKMSTRKGKVVLLDQVLKDVIELAEKNIEERNPALANKAETARMVGVGAVIFHDLKTERQNNVEFSLEAMLRFEGTTGPYVQYTHARACSILRKSGMTAEEITAVGLDDSYSWEVIKDLIAFPEMIQKSFEQSEPSVIARYAIELAQDFNKYYSHVKVLEDDEHLEGRLALVFSVTVVLKESLRLLGIHAPDEM
ncbi:arginine--tRNA ligase [Planococcus halotolerans]|uniref:arginine--tRNA ligase n=1 Tax=Planococcus halotolerans TaxID=2233542 RepID=UPI001092A6F4|nr:arginine--tRNA ligase [Planococcus halotolerans]QHJ70972.1 arginine--tRNA ligase [Planococcus halotolerans]